MKKTFPGISLLLMCNIAAAGVVSDPNAQVNITDNYLQITKGPIEGVLDRGLISYSEGFKDPAGNSIVKPFIIWDELDVNPSAGNPLELVPGTAAGGGLATENLYGIDGVSAFPPMLAGCGPTDSFGGTTVNCDQPNGKGAGSVAMLFDDDTDAVKLEIIAPVGIEVNQYLIFAHFFRRDGSFIGSLQVGTNDSIFHEATLDGLIQGTQFGKSEWGFRATGGDMIAGVVVTNQAGAFGASPTLEPEFGIRFSTVSWKRPDPAPQAQVVALDVKAGSCPNPINTMSGGRISVAVLGSETFDVSTIDTSSLLLEGVPPKAVHFEDVSTPYEGNGHGCTTDGPDGYMDLQLKFKVQDILAALGNLLPHELILTGTLMDGTEIKGQDWVIYP